LPPTIANPTRADLLAERAAVRADLADLRARVAAPGYVETPSDFAAAHDLLDREQVVRAALERAPAPHTAARPSYDRVHRVGQEQRTYRADHAAAGTPGFMRDIYLHQIKGDPVAGERLARHGHEVETDDPTWQARAIGTGAVSGLVPPQYLTDLWAQLARAGRPVANLCTPMPLPADGVTINVSRITTGSAAAVQATENTAVSSQDIDDTLLAVGVNTIAGQQIVSRQAVERGVLVEQILWSDLTADYNAKLDIQCVNGSGASGQHLGVLNVPAITSIVFTQASPTVPLLWPKLADAARQVVGQRFTGPTAWVMNPLMWGWIGAALGTDNRPLIDRRLDWARSERPGHLRGAAVRGGRGPAVRHPGRAVRRRSQQPGRRRERDPDRHRGLAGSVPDGGQRRCPGADPRGAAVRGFARDLVRRLRVLRAGFRPAAEGDRGPVRHRHDPADLVAGKCPPVPSARRRGHHGVRGPSTASGVAPRQHRWRRPAAPAAVVRELVRRPG
jgi:HK97 family phage major capsid protein